MEDKNLISATEVEGLVKRLQRYGKPAMHPGIIAYYSEDLALKAATALTALQAEIERLRAERDAWKEMAKELAEAGCAIDVLHGSFGKARLSWQKSLVAYAKLKGEA